MPEISAPRYRSGDFDRCTNPCSLHPPPAALAGFARAGSQNLAFLGSAPGLWILSLRYTCDGLDQLASTTKGSRTITCAYNGDGTRNTKTVDTTTTQYYYVNGRLQALTKDIYTAFFLYDDTGRPYNTREPSPCVIKAFGRAII